MVASRKSLITDQAPGSDAPLLREAPMMLLNLLVALAIVLLTYPPPPPPLDVGHVIEWRVGPLPSDRERLREMIREAVPEERRA